MTTTILVTGGAGYIGSHAVLALQQAGYDVIILDNLAYGHQDLVETVLKTKLIIGDIQDKALLSQVFETYPIAAVMHFSAYIFVGESVQDPAKYYRNNVSGTLTLLEAMIEAGIHKLVFSSTCATYGDPEAIPILEDHPQHPINPYAYSKLMVEQMLKDFDKAYGLQSVIFRYFNAAGADPEGRLGEDHHPETHLIPLILLTALGQFPELAIYGDDYETPDGTCIRDYIHVTDLAQAHCLGLKYLLQGGSSDVFNLGNGQGFSVREVIETARQITGHDIPTMIKPRRPGDLPILVGSAAKTRRILGWQPEFAGLETIITHAWNWHQKRHGKKA